MRAFYQSILNDCSKSGTTVSSIEIPKLEEYPFPLAPLAEQTRIAQKLDEVLAQVDTLKARVDALPAIIKRFRQSVLAAAVSGKLTEEWVKQNDLTPVVKTLESIAIPKRPARCFKSRSTSIIPGDYAISVGKAELDVPKHWHWTLLLDVAKLETGHTDRSELS